MRQAGPPHLELEQVPLRELPAQSLMHAEFNHPALRAALQKVEQADMLLIATPIYKAAYSGLLKAFLDLLPQDGLEGKAVALIATGGSPAHFLAMDYALKPVLASMGARDVLDTLFATDAQLPKDEHGRISAAPDIAQRIARTRQRIEARLN